MLPLLLSLALAASTSDLLPDELAAIRGKYVSPEIETRYLDAQVDLNDDGRPERLVYVIGPLACDAAGCPLLVFSTVGRLITDLGQVHAPIHVSKTRTNGWRDLWVRGAVSRSDGHLYMPPVSQAVVDDAELAIAEPESDGASKLIPPPTTYTFWCQEPATPPFTVRFYNEADPPSALIAAGGHEVIALLTATASGARYLGEGVDFWEHQGQAEVTWRGKAHHCARTDAAARK